ncbi:sodium/potassium/calcium exchanger 3-like [Ceratina calcarata]|uniref:Sodium/potassium/calcium exchanger 3-like n=2 Tax=Ceratina calcarata TaxID=156304 RepID=A0AAJ7ITQ6_9HYME|nr:sodium/potassium/calcium exchanger 3-like [Ceratina calcarata]
MNRILLSKCCACVVVALWLHFPVIYGWNDSSQPPPIDAVSDLSIGTKNQQGSVTIRISGQGRLFVDTRQEDGKQEEKTDCSVAAADNSMDDFPVDLFTPDQRRNGAVVLHALLGFYCFVMTAFVCHDYLLPSVDLICVKMNISTDVAGATFLAMASSFPEMFVNVIGTFLTQSDLGTGTVVGSAVFDTFATPACGALITAHAIPLEWKTLTRDCTVYVISVATLVIIMWDNWITWYESVILIALFVFYLIVLFSGKKIKLCARRVGGRFCTTTSAKLSNIAENSENCLTPDGIYKLRSQNDIYIIDADHRENSNEAERRQDGIPETTSPTLHSFNDEEPKEISMSERLFTWPKQKSVLGKLWYLSTWPLTFLLFITIPDSRIERLKNWYPITFVVSVIWIGITSYLLSWMMTVIGETAGIPDSIMGLTFLAAGGNVPEVASIAILARKGDGNMAMSNTLGANILDILLCLGLPWTIMCLMTGTDLKIESGTLSYSVLSIVACIIVLYAVIWFYNFELNKKVGVICLLLYMTFVVFASLVEMRVFAPDGGKSC